MERKREVAKGGDGREEMRRRESKRGGDMTHTPPIRHPAPRLHHSTVKSQPDGLIVFEMKSRTRKIMRGGNWCVAGRNEHTARNYHAWSLSIRDQSQMYVGLKSMSKGGKGRTGNKNNVSYPLCIAFQSARNCALCTIGSKGCVCVKYKSTRRS